MYVDKNYERILLYRTKKTLHSERITNPEKLVSRENHDFLSLFSEANSNKQFHQESYDNKIQLKEGFEPPFRPLYILS